MRWSNLVGATLASRKPGPISRWRTFEPSANQLTADSLLRLFRKMLADPPSCLEHVERVIEIGDPPSSGL